MARQKKSKIINVITWLLLLLLLVCGIGAICQFVGIGKDDITDMFNPEFRVVYDGKTNKSNTQNIVVLPESGQVQFEVKGAKGYTATIIPNVTAETDFDYTVNGNSYSYSGERDLAYAFDLRCYDTVFTLNLDNGLALESVLSKIWGSNNVTVNEHESISLYKLVVTSTNNEAIEIIFGSCVTDIVMPEFILF